MSETPLPPITPNDLKRPVREQFFAEIRLRVTRESVEQALRESAGGPCTFQTLTVLPRNMIQADVVHVDERSLEITEYLWNLASKSHWDWYTDYTKETRCMYLKLMPKPVVTGVSSPKPDHPLQDTEFNLNHRSQSRDCRLF